MFDIIHGCNRTLKRHLSCHWSLEKVYAGNKGWWENSITLYKIMNGNHKEVVFSSSKDGTTCKKFSDRLEVRINSYYTRLSPHGC